MYFLWVRTPSSHFHMCKEALKQSTTTTCTPLWHFFFSPLQHHASIGRGHLILFCSNLLAKGREGGRIKPLFSPALLTARTCQNRLGVS